MYRKHKIILVNLLLACSYFSSGVQFDAYAQKDSHSLDPTIRHGRLPNGFSYFIKDLRQSQSGLQLQLYHEVLANQEDQDQYNIAHAVEHLAFKSSNNFPTGIENDERIEALNMKRSDITATIGNFSFKAPPENTEALELGILWFKDIIGGLNLTDKDIDQVGGELQQETLMRSGESLNDNFTERRLKVLLFPCRSEAPESFSQTRNYNPEVVRRHYNDWNRPDLMAISIVGEIDDVDGLEKKIQESFGNLPLAQNPRKPKKCDEEYFSRPPQFHLLERPKDTLKVLQNPEVQTWLYFRDSESKHNLDSPKALKRLLLLDLLSAEINNRLENVTRGNRFFKASSKNYHKYSPLFPGLEIQIITEDGRVKDALTETNKILKQLRAYGVNQRTWMDLQDRQVAYLRNIDTTKSRFWQEEIANYYLYGEAIPQNKYVRLAEWLLNLSKDKFNKYIKRFLSKLPEDVGMIAPSDSRVLSLTEEEIRSWISYSDNETSETYHIPKVPSLLMELKQLEQLQLKNFKDNGFGPSGAREIELENGVKVIFQETEQINEDSFSINIHGFSLKGAENYPEEHYYSAINSPLIVQNSGVNGLSKIEIDQFLSQTTDLKQGNIYTYVTSNESGVFGSAGERDVEELLQLIYLSFTKPNKDFKAFEDWKRLEKNFFRSPTTSNNVTVDFNNEIMRFLGEVPSSTLFGRKLLMGTHRFLGMKKTSLDEAMEIYQELFGVAKNFTFIVQGNFEMEKILPMIQKYLGNLPNGSTNVSISKKHQNPHDLIEGPLMTEITPPEYYGMKNMIYGFRFIHNSQYPHDWKEQLRVEALGAIVDHKAWDLRYKKGYSIYSIGARGSFNINMNRNEITSTVRCEEKEFQALREDYKNIIAEIKSGEISNSEFRTGLSRMKFMKSPEMAKHPFLMNQKLYEYYRYGQPWIDSKDIETFVNSLTIADIVKAANKYLIEENLYEFFMKNKE